MNTIVPDAARLRITLFDLAPPWRVIEVPLSMTFKGLRDTIARNSDHKIIGVGDLLPWRGTSNENDWLPYTGTSCAPWS